MATQSGITVAGPNEPWTIAHDIPQPKPGPKEILVKNLAVGINPIEPLMHHTGLLVAEWPAVLGCESSGIVLEIGEGVTRIQPGDHVYGCTRLGINGYTTFQETFLMDESLAFKKSDNISTEQATTIGVGLDTAALCLISGGAMVLPPPGTKATPKDEWALVIGSSGSVGQFGVQLAALCGYKVLAACSPTKASVPLGLGATATVNYQLPQDEYLADIQKITGGKLSHVFDASAMSYEAAVKALEASSADKKYFSSANDWDKWDIPADINVYQVHLGLIGRTDSPIGAEVSDNLASWIPNLEGHLAAGTLGPLEYQVVDGVGFEAVVDGIALLEGRKFEKKLVAIVQKE